MAASLTAKNKVECQVILSLIVVALLLNELDKEAGKTEGEDGPAVKQCTALINELMVRNDEKTRKLMEKRINVNRVKLTKKIKDHKIADALIGALTVLTSGFIRSKPGTRLDYIITMFRANLPNMTLLTKYDPDKADECAEHIKQAIRKTG